MSARGMIYRMPLNIPGIQPGSDPQTSRATSIIGRTESHPNRS